MNITQAILHLNPDAKFTCWENDYNRVTWDASNTKSKPSLSKLNTAWDAIEANTIAMEYKENRVAEYPSIGDQLDLLYKDMLADKGDKTGAWFTAVKTVKDKYPKP